MLVHNLELNSFLPMIIGWWEKEHLSSAIKKSESEDSYRVLSDYGYVLLRSRRFVEIFIIAKHFPHWTLLYESPSLVYRNYWHEKFTVFCNVKLPVTFHDISRLKTSKLPKIFWSCNLVLYCNDFDPLIRQLDFLIRIDTDFLLPTYQWKNVLKWTPGTCYMPLPTDV